MVTISSRTFRYSRRDTEDNHIVYHFVDHRRLRREWRLIHYLDTDIWLPLKIDRRLEHWAREVRLPALLGHAMMAALVRHRRIAKAHPLLPPS